MPPFGELLDHLLAEGGQILRAAAGHQPSVDDHLRVDHGRARIAQIRAQARERGDAPSRHDAGLQQRPWSVADGGDRLAGVEELPDEVDGMLVHPQLVGVDGAARKQQRVVVVDRSVSDEAVDREGPRVLKVVVARRDLAVVDRQQLHLRAGALDRLARLFQFDPLDAIGGQDRHATIVQDIAHGAGSLLVDTASLGRVSPAVMRRSRHLRLGDVPHVAR